MKKLILILLFSSSAIASNPCSEAIPDNAIWKFDQFPGIEKISTVIQGAPNFRQVEKDPVIGMGQPTLLALAQVLAQLPLDQKIYWINLRKEPVLYINGRSFTLRDPQKPFVNLTIPGADADQMHAIEWCLKEQLTQKAVTDGMLDLFDEISDMKVVHIREHLFDIATLKETFEDRGVFYFRVPIEDERAPSAENLQRLAKIFESLSPDSLLIANCHAGRGRTTTAIAAFYIWKGLDADTAIDKVGAIQNLRTAIETAKPKHKQDYQDRYDSLLKFSQQVKSANP